MLWVYSIKNSQKYAKKKIADTAWYLVILRYYHLKHHWGFNITKNLDIKNKKFSCDESMGLLWATCLSVNTNIKYLIFCGKILLKSQRIRKKPWVLLSADIVIPNPNKQQKKNCSASVTIKRNPMLSPHLYIFFSLYLSLLSISTQKKIFRVENFHCFPFQLAVVFGLILLLLFE